MLTIPALPSVDGLKPEEMWLPPASLVSIPRYQVRVKPCPKTVDKYAKAYRRAKRRPDALRTLTIFEIGSILYVVDGHHRLAAALKAGVEEVHCVVHENKTDAEAIEFVCGSNLDHGLSRRGEDTRRAVFMYLDTFPFDPASLPSIRKVAKVCGLKSRASVTRYYTEWRKAHGLEDIAETITIEASRPSREAGDDEEDDEPETDEPDMPEPVPSRPRDKRDNLVKGPPPKPETPNYPVLAFVAADQRPLILADAAFYRDFTDEIKPLIGALLRRHEKTAGNGVFFNKVRFMNRMPHPKDWQACDCGNAMACHCRGRGYKV
jgi:hypothetical protein